MKLVVRAFTCFAGNTVSLSGPQTGQHCQCTGFALTGNLVFYESRSAYTGNKVSNRLLLCLTGHFLKQILKKKKKKEKKEEKKSVLEKRAGCKCCISSLDGHGSERLQ